MPEPTPDSRCRIVLIAPDIADDEALAEAVSQALAGGDVASLILPAWGADDQAFQRRAEMIVPLAQAQGVAVMIVDDTRVAGRTGADGVHLEDARRVIAESRRRFDSHLMFGAGGARTRHDALELGEAQPDYLFFGKIGYDNKPEPHPRNLALGQWWADLVEIPCVVLAGSDLDSVAEVAATGAEFVALGHAVFDDPQGPRHAIEKANALLDRLPARTG